MLTVEQIRSARAYLGWSQKDLADRAGLSQTGLARIENGTHKPNTQTLAKIAKAFEESYIEFIPDGIRKVSDIVQVREGPDSYLELLNEAYKLLANTGEEILFWAADEKRSSQAVIDKTKKMRQNDIKMRFLIQDGNSYFMGKPDEYRWLNKDLYIESDVKVIFKNRVSFLISWRNTSRVITIRDQNIYQEHKRLFDYLWDNAKGPEKSISEVFYE